MKKVLGIVLAVVLCVAFATTAFTADITGSAGETSAVSSGATIEGTIQPIQISAVVPTKVVFDIDPNKAANYEANTASDPGKAFTSAAFDLQNTCNAPLTFSVNSISAQDSAPAVVANDTFDDAVWQKLTKTQTLANIAFGFTMPTTSEWLTADNADAWYAPSTALTLGDIAGQSTATESLKAKYGLAWGNTVETTITYDIVYGVAVAE